MRVALQPLSIPSFRLLFVARSANELGFWLGQIALAIVVFDRTGSALATAVLFLATELIPAVVAPGLVTRVEALAPRVSLPALYVGEAAALLALGLAATSLPIPVVIALTAIDGVFSLVARALTRASAAYVLKPVGQLRPGNALINLVVTGGAAVGPALAGGVIGGFGIQPALLVAAGALLVTALVLGVPNALPPSAVPPEEEGEGWRTRLRAGLAYVRERALLRRLIAAQAVALIFLSLVVPIEVIYAKETLDVGNAGYGALLAAWGAGMVLGSLLFAGAGRIGLRPLLLVSALAMGAAYLGFAAAGSLAVACAAAVVGGAGNGVGFVALTSAVQEMTEQHYQARVVGLLESVSAATPGVGFLLGGAIVTVSEPRVAYLVAGLGVGLVVALFTPLLRRTAWPAEAAAAPGSSDSALDNRRPADSAAAP